MKFLISISRIGLPELKIGNTTIDISSGIKQHNMFKYALCNAILQEFSRAEQSEIKGNAG